MIAGSDSVTQLQRDSTKKVSLTGINDFARLLTQIGLYWERLHITPDYAQQDVRWDLSDYHLICNMVTDADHNPRTLKVAERLCDKLNRPVINHPGRIHATARDRLPSILEGIPGIIMPRTIRLKSATPEELANRVAQEGLRWPLLVKDPGIHDGRFVGLFKSPDQFAPRLGEEGKDYLLTEFANFKSPDGLYRKCRFWCIGRTIMLRHHVTDKTWNLHGRNREALMAERPDLRRDEEEFLERQLSAFSTPTIEALEAIRERIGLDYFGIDCHVRPNGKIVVFEANATMNYRSHHEGAPEYGYIDRILGPIVEQAVRNLTDEKMAQTRDLVLPDNRRFAG